MTVFVDSKVWFAAAVARDRDNARARAIISGARDFITGDHALGETWTLLESGYGRAVAEQFWQRLRQARVRIETVAPVDLEAAAHSSAGSFVDRLMDSLCRHQ
jgi:predicted nucleic acid-binding protein